MSYCPYPIDKDPKHFGLIQENFETTYGTLNTVHTRPTTDTVTLFLHGVGGSWASWTPLLQAVQHGHYSLGDVLLVDLPGFGSSVNSQDNLDMTTIGHELLAIAASLGWKKVHLVGHSMGGFLAIDMASRGSQNVASLAVISGAYFSIVETVQHPFRSLFNHRATAQTYGSMWLLAKLGPTGLHIMKKYNSNARAIRTFRATAAKPALLKVTVLASIVDGMRPQSFIQAAQNGKNYDAVVQWGHITIPTIALFGAYDTLVPEKDMRQFKNTVKQSRIVLLKDAGHFGLIEQPDEVARELFSAPRL